MSPRKKFKITFVLEGFNPPDFTVEIIKTALRDTDHDQTSLNPNYHAWQYKLDSIRNWLEHSEITIEELPHGSGDQSIQESGHHQVEGRGTDSSTQ